MERVSENGKSPVRSAKKPHSNGAFFMFKNDQIIAINTNQNVYHWLLNKKRRRECCKIV